MNSTTRRPLSALRFRVAAVAFAAFASTLALAAPASAAFQQTLNIKQGLAFQSSNTSAFGQVTAFKIGSLTLTPDLQSSDPSQAPVASLAAVGILSSDSWAELSSSPLTLEFQVSAANRAALATYLSQTPSSAAVSLSFRAYGYDATLNRWYQTFAPYNDGTLDGQIAQTAGQLQISVASEPDVVAGNLYTYKVHVQIVPNTGTGEILLEKASATASRVLVW